MSNSNSNRIGLIIIVVAVIVTVGGLFYLSRYNPDDGAVLGETREKTDFVTTKPQVDGNFGTFSVDSSLPICKEDGKPVIYLFSTTWCPHCKWITATYEKVAKEYMDLGKIIAYHYEFDIKDDTLTEINEKSIPVEAQAVNDRFNSQGTVPTFVFGCKYFRVGNGYEQDDDLAAEETEFRQIIEKLIAETAE
jgi:thiol-disulfide isomerase/thioredoxin